MVDPDPEPRVAANQVRDRIHAIRVFQGLVWIGTTLCAAAAAWLGTLAIAAAVDSVWVPDLDGRTLLHRWTLGTGWTTMLVVLGWQWRRQVALGELIRHVEQHVPGLHHGVVTIEDRLHTDDPHERKLVAKLAASVWETMQAVAPERLVRTRPLAWAAAILSVALIGAAVCLVAVEQGRLAMAHVLFSDTSPSYTRITDQSELSSLVAGGAARFQVALEGRPQEAAMLHLDFGDDIGAPVPIPIKDGAGAIRVDDIHRSFSYSIKSGDGRTEVKHVSVIHEPRLRDATAIIIPPAYTRRPPRTRPLTAIRALEGSEVIFRAVFEDPVVDARLDRTPGDSLPLTAAADGGLETRIALDQSFDFTLTAADARTPAGTFALRGTVVVLPDGPPGISILEPEGDVEVQTNAVVHVQADIQDDSGIRDARLVLQVNTGEPWTVSLELQTNTAARVRVGHDVRLGELGLSAGDILSYHVIATDRHPETSRTGTSELRFIDVVQATKQSVDRGESRPFTVNPFRRFLQIQKQVVADSFALMHPGIPPPPSARRAVQHELGRREQALAAASADFGTVVREKAEALGTAAAGLEGSPLLAGLAQVAEDLAPVATNYFAGRTEAAHAGAEAVLALLQRLSAASEEQSPVNRVGPGEDMTAERDLLQALWMAEREAAERRIEKAERELERLDELRESLDRYQDTESELAAAHESPDTASGASGQRRNRLAERLSKLAGDLLSRGLNGPIPETEAFESMAADSERIRKLVESGATSNAVEALKRSMDNSDAIARDVMRQEEEQLAESLATVADELARMAERQSELATRTREGEPSDSGDGLRDQDQLMDSWMQFAEAVRRAHDSSGISSNPDLREIQAFAEDPTREDITGLMQTAAEDLRRQRPEDAAVAQERAANALARLSEQASGLGQRMGGTSPETLSSRAREAQALAEAQSRLRDQLDAGPDELTSQGREEWLAGQRRVTQRLQRLAAASNDDAELAPLARANRSARLAAGHMQQAAADMAPARERAAIAAEALAEASRILHHRLHQEAAGDLIALRDRVRDRVQSPDGVTPVDRVQIQSDLEGLAVAFADHALKARIRLAGSGWRRTAPTPRTDDLGNLLHDLESAVNSLEQSELARLETFMTAAQWIDAVDADPASVRAAVEAAVDSGLDDAALDHIAAELSDPGGEPPGRLDRLTSLVHDLVPVASARIDHLRNHGRELLPDDEAEPPGYAEDVGEYFRSLTYQ